MHLFVLFLELFVIHVYLYNVKVVKKTLKKWTGSYFDNELIVQNFFSVSLLKCNK